MLLDVAAEAMGFRPLPGRPERLFISLSALPPLQH